jgi:hypothetical protein
MLMDHVEKAIQMLFQMTVSGVVQLGCKSQYVIQPMLVYVRLENMKTLPNINRSWIFYGVSTCKGKAEVQIFETAQGHTAFWLEQIGELTTEEISIVVLEELTWNCSSYILLYREMHERHMPVGVSLNQWLAEVENSRREFRSVRKSLMTRGKDYGVL